MWGKSLQSPKGDAGKWDISYEGWSGKWCEPEENQFPTSCLSPLQVSREQCKRHNLYFLLWNAKPISWPRPLVTYDATLCLGPSQPGGLPGSFPPVLGPPQWTLSWQEEAKLWINNKGLLCSAGNYIQSSGLDHDRKEYLKRIFKKNDWVTLLYSRNWHSIVNQLQWKKWKKKKKKKQSRGNARGKEGFTPRHIHCRASQRDKPMHKHHTIVWGPSLFLIPIPLHHGLAVPMAPASSSAPFPPQWYEEVGRNRGSLKYPQEKSIKGDVCGLLGSEETEGPAGRTSCAKAESQPNLSQDHISVV